MPFDYNSFLQGVQTGLKLGRTKLGRQPPVPSDMYILTQDGTPVITDVSAPEPGQGVVTLMDGTTYPIININYNTTYNSQNWYAYVADVPSSGGITELGEYILRTDYRFLYYHDDDLNAWRLRFSNRDVHISTFQWNDVGGEVPSLYFYYNSSSRYSDYPYALLAYYPESAEERTQQGPVHWTTEDFEEQILYREPEQYMLTE